MRRRRVKRAADALSNSQNGVAATKRRGAATSTRFGIGGMASGVAAHSSAPDGKGSLRQLRSHMRDLTARRAAWRASANIRRRRRPLPF